MKKKKSDIDQASQILLYQTEDGQTRLEVQLQKDTVWLSLNQMADLFQRDKSVISKHIKNIFEEGELSQDSTVAKFATVQSEGSRQVERDIESYNLDVIISVGYRVHSHRGTQFRIWATQRLHEYIVKGFTLDDERLKQSGGGNYFDELLSRIRDIRSSEKVFWRKVLDIYATSIDYDPNTEVSQKFFATVQNKMHWAAHGQTAAEVITERADASKPYMGLTSWSGTKLRKSDVSIAKNYLNEKELSLLNRIVTAYLEFAELQAVRQKAMSSTRQPMRLKTLTFSIFLGCPIPMFCMNRKLKKQLSPTCRHFFSNWERDSHLSADKNGCSLTTTFFTSTWSSTIAF